LGDAVTATRALEAQFAELLPDGWRVTVAEQRPGLKGHAVTAAVWVERPDGAKRGVMQHKAAEDWTMRDVAWIAAALGQWGMR
jgi:hypothetical protein